MNAVVLRCLTAAAVTERRLQLAPCCQRGVSAARTLSSGKAWVCGNDLLSSFSAAGG